MSEQIRGTVVALPFQSELKSSGVSLHLYSNQYHSLKQDIGIKHYNATLSVSIFESKYSQLKPDAKVHYFSLIFSLSVLCS